MSGTLYKISGHFFVAVFLFTIAVDSTSQWETAEVLLGALPEHHNEEKTYDLSVPPEAKEVLVYAYITAQGEGSFQRGYYEISTSDRAGSEYKQYMNVATGNGVTIVNSANLWFPKGNGMLKIKLVCADCESGKRSIRGVTPANVQWSDAFVIGYRV